MSEDKDVTRIQGTENTEDATAFTAEDKTTLSEIEDDRTQYVRGDDATVLLNDDDATVLLSDDDAQTASDSTEFAATSFYKSTEPAGADQTSYEKTHYTDQDDSTVLLSDDDQTVYADEDDRTILASEDDQTIYSSDDDQTVYASDDDATVIDASGGSSATSITSTSETAVSEGSSDTSVTSATSTSETAMAEREATRADTSGLTEAKQTEARAPTSRTKSGATTGYTGSTKVNPTGAKVLGSAQAGVIKDRFVLEARLGKGGMGQVFRALDLRKHEAKDDQPRVAIKFLGEEFAKHPKALISLQREAKKTQQLAHPNILTVYDFDREGDRVYMTMELLDGAPLGDWQGLEFQEGKKPTPELLILEMAKGLGYAHKQGFVHSDLKPDNVFVTTNGRLKILDFGIARAIESAAGQTDSFDAGSLGALTVRYASLEMLERDSEPHPSDDIYALGLMAYQLFVGKHPYGGLSAKKALEQGVKPERPKNLKRFQWQAISKAIQLQRKDRTQSVEEFIKVFSGSKFRTQALVSTIGVLVLSSAVLAYYASQGDGPAIPFSELPPEVQAEFKLDINNGYKSIEISDWDGASRYFIAAYQTHPRNPEAEAGLELFANHLVSLGEKLKSPRQRAYLLSTITAYDNNEFLASHTELQALRKSLEQEGMTAPGFNSRADTGGSLTRPDANNSDDQNGPRPKTGQ